MFEFDLCGKTDVYNDKIGAHGAPYGSPKHQNVGCAVRTNSNATTPQFKPKRNHNMNESIIPLEQFNAHASEQIKAIHESSTPLILTENGHATAVVEDYAQYKRQQKALAMLKLMVQGESDIQQEQLTPQLQVFDELKARLKAEPSHD